MSDASRGEGNESLGENTPAASHRKTQVFREFSIGLPARAEALLELPVAEALVPSRFQPEHTLVAAMECLVEEVRRTDPVTVDPAFGSSSGR